METVVEEAKKVVRLVGVSLLIVFGVVIFYLKEKRDNVTINLRL